MSKLKTEPCVKCGSTKAKIHWSQAGCYAGVEHDEFLRCICKRCGWSWRMPCADAPEAILRDIEIAALASREVAEICS